MHLAIFQSLLLSTAALDCLSFWCYPEYVRHIQLGDTWCDPYCMNGGCNFDKGQDGVSDCQSFCADTGCDVALLGNGVCDQQCNSLLCGADFGDCGFCAQGCLEGQLGNGICDQVCDTQLCQFDAGDCGNCASGCFTSMVGDGNCDPSCMNTACAMDMNDCESTLCAPGCYAYMIDDLQCEEACNVAACRYDGEDCFCSPGCTPDLLTNSVCDPECATVACGLDGGLCVSSTQGDCANGCLWSMVGDGTCDQQCYTEECHYDVQDCGCAPGCTFDMYGRCEFPCLVPSCGYDNCTPSDFNFTLAFSHQVYTSDLNRAYDYERDCHSLAYYCTYEAMLYLWLYNFFCWEECAPCGASQYGACSNEKPANCIRGFGSSQCFLCKHYQLGSSCVDRCPTYAPSLPNSVNSFICYPAVDLTLPESPGVMYVSNTGNAASNGTYSLPYDQLWKAFATTYQKYTLIYLLNGVHQLTPADSSAPEAALLVDPNQPLNNTFHPHRLTVATLLCSESFHPDCATSRATIHVSSPLLRFTISNFILVLQNLIIDSAYTLLPGCDRPACFYCPSISPQYDGTFIDDRGNIVTAGTYAPSNLCAPYSNSMFFYLEMTGEMALFDVDIVNFRYHPKALIYSKGGNMTFVNVNISNIIPNLGYGAVILQDSCVYSNTYGCGNLHFQGGTVAYINNGYEYARSVGFGAFLYAVGMTDIVFRGVIFTKNLVVGEGQPRGLISLVNHRSLLLDNCTFDTNAMSYGVLVNSPKFNFANTLENGIFVDTMLEHIQITHCNFSYNVAEYSLISTYHSLYLQSVVIHDSEFYQNYALNSVLLTFTYTSNLDYEVVTGEALSLNGVVGWLAPRHENITNCSFKKSYGENVIYMKGAPNLKMMNLTLEVAGTPDNLNYNFDIIRRFDLDPQSYMINSHPMSNLEPGTCTAVIKLGPVSNLLLRNATFTKTRCNSGPVGLAISSTLSPYVSSDITITSTFAGSALTLSFAPGEFERLNVSNVMSLGGGGFVQIDGFSPFVCRNCVFERNYVFSSGVVYGIEASQITLIDSLFKDNYSYQGSGGGVFYVLHPSLTSLSFTVTSCVFLNNTSAGGSGGAIMLSNTRQITGVLEITITDTVFERNTAFLSGSALYISTLVPLTPTSTITTCQFLDNTSPLGAVAIYFQVGTLSLSDCLFEHSSMSSFVCSTQSPAQVILHNCVFQRHLHGAMDLMDSSVRKRVTTKYCLFKENQSRAVTAQNASWTDEYSSFQGPGPALSLTLNTHTDFAYTLFIDNHSPDNGGAISLASQSVFTCMTCLFINNHALAKGGAIFLEQNSSFALTNSEFRENTCGEKGSALFLLSCTALSTLTHSNLTGNSDKQGGSVVLFLSSLAVSDVRFEDNQSEGLTPGLVLTLSTLDMQSSRLKRHAGVNGAFLYATTESTVRIENSVFEEGKAETGGGFYVLANSEVTLVDCEVRNVTAVNGGGMYVLASSVITLQSCTFTDVSATTGGSFVALSQSQVIIQGTTMLRITAPNAGLGMITEGQLHISSSHFLHFSEGGIVSQLLSLAELQSSTFVSGQSVGQDHTGGAFECVSCDMISIVDCRFEGNEANLGGAVYLATRSDANINAVYSVQDTVFVGNSGKSNGGALYTESVSVFLHNCTFIENNAKTEGGGIAFHCALTDFCDLQVRNCSFIRNQAQENGGAIAWHDVRPVITDPIFDGNRAGYGANISSFAVELSVLGSNALVLASGQLTNQSLGAVLLDHYGQQLSQDNSSVAEVQVTDNSTQLAGVVKLTAVRGLFNFSAFMVIAQPGHSVELRVQTSAVDETQSGKARDNVTYAGSFTVKVQLRQCVFGESQVGSTCQVCEATKYSLDPTSSMCQSCPNDGVCYGSYYLVPKAGYWRARIDSDMIYACLHPAACLGSPAPPMPLELTGKCEQGYQGNLCAVCSPGYSQTRQYECSRCPSRNNNIGMLVAAGIGLGLLAALMVYTSLRTAQRDKSDISIYLRIFLNYLQVVTLITTFNLDWPQQVLDLFDVQRSAGFSTQTLSIDCLLRDDTEDGGVLVFRRLVATAVFPLGLGLAACIVWVVLYPCVKPSRSSLVVTLIILLFLIHPLLTKQLFAVFTCITIDNQSYLLEQLDVKCWDGEHVSYAVTCALPAILVWILGLPSLCLLYLIKQRRKLSLINVRQRLGFLFSGFKTSAFYWEFLILYRKIGIICCSVFLAKVSVPIQALCLLLLLLLSLYLQEKIHPYNSLALNQLELKSVLCATITIYCGLYYLTKDLGTQAKLTFFVLIIAANCYFVGFWCFYMLQKLSKLMILRFFPNLNQFESWTNPAISSKHSIFPFHNSLKSSKIIEIPESMKHIFLERLKNPVELRKKELKVPENSAELEGMVDSGVELKAELENFR